MAAAGQAGPEGEEDPLLLMDGGEDEDELLAFTWVRPESGSGIKVSNVSARRVDTSNNYLPVLASQGSFPHPCAPYRDLLFHID
jgi:hypothetical protein